MTAQRLAYGFAAVTTICCAATTSPTTPTSTPGCAPSRSCSAPPASASSVGAIVTPLATRRLGIRRWVALGLVASAVVELVFGLPYTLPMLAVGGALLGACAQAIRVCVDTVVQRSVLDEFRGRVFAIYDVLYNVAFVLAAVVAAALIPADGRSPASLVVVAVAYLAVTAWWLRVSRDDDGLTRHLRLLLPPAERRANRRFLAERSAVDAAGRAGTGRPPTTARRHAEQAHDGAAVEVGPDRGELLLLRERRDPLFQLVVGARQRRRLAPVARGAVGGVSRCSRDSNGPASRT